MSRAVLISIRPKWCELIASGKKTIEVRKTAPKISTPFKCYIYCTKDNKAQFWIARTYFYLDDHAHNAFDKCGNGMIIGEYVCNEISRYAKYGQRNEPARYMRSSPGGYPATEIHFSSLQLSANEIEQYGKGSQLYGLHISDTVIYDVPKQLRDFEVFRTKHITEKAFFQEGVCDEIRHVRVLEPLSRPPQSWCYVEELP